MKKTLFTFLIALLSVGYSHAGVLVLDGQYQGKDLYVQNPFLSSGVGFCAFEVTVNGEISSDELNSSAFIIDLAVWGLKKGSPLEVIIKYKDGCVPKVLNPEVLKPSSTYEIVSCSIGKDGVYKWQTKNESGVLPYIVEQYRWNKWVKVGEVAGLGKSTTNDYAFKVEPHSGENVFRLKQIDHTKKPRYSQEVKFIETNVSVVEFTPKKASDEINFTQSTMFEIFDQYGNLVKKGFSNAINVSNLKKGTYYINYDSNFGDSFVKK